MKQQELIADEDTLIIGDFLNIFGEKVFEEYKRLRTSVDLSVEQFLNSRMEFGEYISGIFSRDFEVYDEYKIDPVGEVQCRTGFLVVCTASDLAVNKIDIHKKDRVVIIPHYYGKGIATFSCDGLLHLDFFGESRCDKCYYSKILDK